VLPWRDTKYDSELNEKATAPWRMPIARKSNEVLETFDRGCAGLIVPKVGWKKPRNLLIFQFHIQGRGNRAEKGSHRLLRLLVSDHSFNSLITHQYTQEHEREGQQQ